MNPNQKTTRLGTSRKFQILRPSGAPKGPRGLYYLSDVALDWGTRVCAIRSDTPSGKWRIDLHSCGNLWEVLPGLDGMFETPREAATALVSKFPYTKV